MILYEKRVKKSSACHTYCKDASLGSETLKGFKH